MSEPYCINKRFAVAIMVSIIMHLLLFFIPVHNENIYKNMFQNVIYVNLELPMKTPEKLELAVSKVDSKASVEGALSSTNTKHGLSGISKMTDRYYQYYEVDKISEFVYTAPIVNVMLTTDKKDIKGRIKANVFINELGFVDSVIILEAEPTTDFNGVFLSALSRSRFAPAKKDGKIVKSQKIMELIFDTKK